MATPAELLSNFHQAVLEVERAQKAILTLSRDSEASVRVLYRMALYMLHEQHDLEGAANLLQKLSACTVVCESRSEARISYALLLWTRQQYDDAIAMLNRVVFEEKNPVHRALALDYLGTFSREQGMFQPAIAKIDEQRIQVLQTLVASEQDRKPKADYQLRLDAALQERESSIN